MNFLLNENDDDKSNFNVVVNDNDNAKVPS